MNKKLVFAIVCLVIALGLIAYWTLRPGYQEPVVESPPENRMPTRGLAPGAPR